MQRHGKKNAKHGILRGVALALAFTKVRMRVLHGSESALKTVVFRKAKG